MSRALADRKARWQNRLMIMAAKRRGMRLDGLFDRTGTVQRPSYAKLPKEFWALVADRSTPPNLAEFPSGDGHVVLVVPAFLTNDFLMKPLHRFLSACGYRAVGWGLGVNWGPTNRIAQGLRARLDELYALNGPVSVVGVSLGGVMARDLAYDRPREIRQVITLASPFHLPTASTIEGLFRLCALFHSQQIDPQRLTQKLPVPSTAIYTKDDGIVAWQSCFSSDNDCFVAQVEGPHMSIGRNPAALRVLATRLAAIAPPRPSP
jgi:pimeloyl-ACP methyl ester carboxylesterase